MSGLFDRLQDEIENREGEGGISPLDLGDLPSQLKKLMRHMLREVEVPFDKIWEHIQTLPEDEQMTKDDLGAALSTLTNQGWIIALGEKDTVRYRVNLRHKPRSNLADNIWAALDDKIEARTESEPTEGTKGGES
jgi:hypothetical protein